MAHRSSYPLQREGPLVAAHGIELLGQGSNPGLRYWEHRISATDPQGSPQLRYSLPGKFHGQRSPVGYSPWGCKEWDLTEHAHTCSHTHTHMLTLTRTHTWVWIPALPLTGLVTLGSFPSLASASFSPRDTWAYEL